MQEPVLRQLGRRRRRVPLVGLEAARPDALRPAVSDGLLFRDRCAFRSSRRHHRHPGSGT